VDEGDRDVPEPGRRPLKPLPQQLGGSVREFTEQLRAVYWDRTELNQRGLAQALHLTKSPVSRYLNGQEVIPADTLAALCEIAGLTPRERQRLDGLREKGAEAAERGKNTPEQEPGRTSAGAEAAPVRPRKTGVIARLRSPAGLGALAALAAVAAVCAVAFAVVGADWPGGSANTTADEPGSSPSCRTTRVYRVIQDGDILDAGRDDIGDVRTDDVFRLDKAPAGSPYRFRDYGHVAGSRTKGYVDQAKLKALGSRCVGEHG
jgi:transcriptional regulator with XRE-family HTH domain